MSAHDDARSYLLLGAVLGAIVSLGPSSCCAYIDACDAYALGSGRDCRVSMGDCVCADGLDVVKLSGAADS